MAIAPVAHVSVQTANGGTASSAIDTSGASLLVASIAWVATAATPVPTDSKGNTWTLRVGVTNDGAMKTAQWSSTPSSVGSGHTFSCSSNTGINAAVTVSAYSGVDTTSPFDQENHDPSSSNPPGSVTPTADNELLVCHIGTDGNPTAINSSFTVYDTVAAAGGNFGGGHAYQIQTTATARNPTWTSSGTSNGTGIATFKAAVARPFIPPDFQNPTRRTRPSDRFGFSAALDLPQFFYVPPRPFYQNNWPLPVRRKNAPAWQQSLTASLVIPRDADYFYAYVWVTIDGVPRAQGRSGGGSIDYDSLTITDVIDQTPNTCAFTARGFTPTVGMEVVITLGSATTASPTRIFAGTILQAEQVYRSADDQPFVVSCIDWTWQLNKRKVIKQYTGWTATAIAIDLLATYTSGFTCNNVAGLETIDLISFTNVDLTDALTQLAKRAGGYWYVDYDRDLHLFVAEGGSQPTVLTKTHSSLSAFAIERDLSQWITRQYSEGGGGNAATAVSVGETILPVDVSTWYQEAGGIVTCGPQRLTYSGVQAGGAGALVGPGAAPSAGPGVALVAGVGIEHGVHTYAYTDVTAAGETIPSPLASLTTGPITAPLTDPATGPTPGSPLAGGNGPDPGVHYYAFTGVVAGQETLPSPLSAAVTTRDVVPPFAGPTLSDDPALTPPINSHWVTGDSVYMATTYVNSSGETTAGASSNTLVAQQATGQPAGVAATPAVTGIVVSTDATVTGKRLYVNVNGSWLGYIALTAGQTVATSDLNTTSLTAGSPPITNGAHVCQVVLAVPLAATGATSRNIYRTAAGGSQLRRVGAVADNVTTAAAFADNVLDASLGAFAPTANTTSVTTDYSQVALTGIAVGSGGTTSRKVYRTAAGASQLKLLATIANNSTTTLSDAAADSTLGANAPVTDTSGLTQGTGQVIAGSTLLPTSGAGPFPSTGWAIIGNGQQVIRYSGISGNSLTGIPSTGVGAIVAPVGYNTTVTAAPQLTGIPASGDGSIVYAIPQGAPVNIVAKVDDGAGQIELAALIGGDGVQESYVIDGRIAYTEALARATARIALNNTIRESLAYTVRDPMTASGKTIGVVDLPPGTTMTAEYQIQRVTITRFRPSLANFPTYTAEASSARFSFEDLLRNVLTQAGRP